MSTQSHTPGPLEALKETTQALAHYEMIMHGIIGASQYCDCASFGMAQECRNEWNGAVRTLEVARAAIAKAESAHKNPLGFKWIAFIGGGEGPDVWDKEILLDAADIVDATRQAQGQAEEMGAWVFSVTQVHSPDNETPLRNAAKDLLAVVEKAKVFLEEAIRGQDISQLEANELWDEARKALLKASGRQIHDGVGDANEHLSYP